MRDISGMNSSKWPAMGVFTFDSVILILLAFLTVNRFGPEFLNADVILFSLISLKHVTLFCWGQDRQANILPFAISFIRNPGLNLYVYLLTSAAINYVLIWFWADRLSKMSFSNSQHIFARREIFVVLVSLLFFIVTPGTAFEILLLHDEYALSYLLLGVAFFYFFGISKPFWKLLTVTGVCLAMAIGINYSILIPALCLAGGRALFKRKLDIDLIIFSVLAAVIFISWGLAVRFCQHSTNVYVAYYTNFEFTQLNHSVQMVIKNLIDAVHLGNVFVVLLAVFLSKIFIMSQPQKNISSDYTRTSQFAMLLLMFSAGWLLLFSVNSWVITNLFSWRYFMPLIYVGMILLSLEVRNITVFLRKWQRYALSFGLAAYLIVFLARPFVPLRDYAVFKRLETVLPGNVTCYAGDYWSVWPAVMKNLLERKNGFGFTYRAEGDLDNMKQYLSRYWQGHSTLPIVCLNETVVQCHLLVKSYLNDVVFDGARLAGEGVWLMNFHQRHDDVVMNGPLGERGFALKLSAENVPAEWKRDELRLCRIRVKNNGNVTLAGIGNDFKDPGKYAIHLSYRWVEARSLVPLSGFDIRTDLYPAVKPNAEITMYMGIKAPSKPGTYWLEIEAVQELVAWFKDKGYPGIRVETEVK